MITLVTFSDKRYRSQQELIHKSVPQTDDWTHLNLTNEDWLERTEFYKENKHILGQSRGAGYWLWKPYLLYQIAKDASDGDIFLYMDCGDSINDYGAVSKYLKSVLAEDREFLGLMGCFPQSMYTKRDCFIGMDCDTQYYWGFTQIEAGVIAFKNTPWVRSKILAQWLTYALNQYLLTDLPNIYGKENLPDFKDHRHDQSILTNILASDNSGRSLVDNGLRQWINCNAV